ncbi:MAG: Trk system potassium transporter TrkA [Clostridia bacterium]|nr:Trk system potassium transporter TrkA [Clostridia bacterium]
MKIIILGCGKVGTALAGRLSEENHSITVIDNRSEKVDYCTEKFDVMGIVGNGSSISVLNEAGLNEADVFISVTGTDEVNLLCCMFAKKAGKCRAIARVRNPEYFKEMDFIQEQLGITTTINPEMATAREIYQLLMFPGALKIDSFAEGKARIIKFQLDEAPILRGTCLRDIALRLKENILICCVQRGQSVIIPDGDFVLHRNDIISFISTPESATHFFKTIGVETKPVRNSLIVGGGRIGYYLAHSLIESGVDVRLIDIDKKKCNELSVSLPKATILKGDATDREFLIQEGLELTDSFVSLTGLDEENIMLGLFASQHSRAKVVTKVNRLEFDDILQNLDIGSTVFPKHITSDFIIQYVRALETKAGSTLKTMYRILDDRVEALEFTITKDSAFTGVPLHELMLKPNTLIACINRGGKIIIPRGSDTIKVGDSVIVVTLEHGHEDFRDFVR